MGQLPDLQEARRRLGLALDVFCHDRWVLGYLRGDRWYSEEDVHYAARLGITLARMVAAVRVPLARLNEIESEVAQLLSYGLSEPEIARAIRFDNHRTRALVDGVTRKLKLVTTDDMALSYVERPTRRREFRL